MDRVDFVAMGRALPASRTCARLQSGATAPACASTATGACRRSHWNPVPGGPRPGGGGGGGGGTRWPRGALDYREAHESGHPEKPLRAVVRPAGTIGHRDRRHRRPPTWLVGVWVSNLDKDGQGRRGWLSRVGRDSAIMATTDRDELIALAPDAIAAAMADDRVFEAIEDLRRSSRRRQRRLQRPGACSAPTGPCRTR